MLAKLDGVTSRSCNGQTPLRMANIQNMTTAAIEEYLAARKTLEKFDGAKPTKAPTAKTAKPASPSLPSPPGLDASRCQMPPKPRSPKLLPPVGKPPRRLARSTLFQVPNAVKAVEPAASARSRTVRQRRAVRWTPAPARRTARLLVLVGTVSRFSRGDRWPMVYEQGHAHIPTGYRFPGNPAFRGRA